MDCKQEIRQLAESVGMDLCGFAGIDRFGQSPEGRHPCDILPGCKTVIVLGVRLLDGVIQANFRAFEDGRRDLKGLYNTYGYAMLPNFQLTYACYAVAQRIERSTGEVATPCSTGPMTNGIQLSLRHAAVAAGLGEFGWSDLVLTPQFGPRNRFGVILTTAELEPDPMYSGEKLCDPAKCGICTRVCPTAALSQYGKAPATCGKVGDVAFEYNTINRPRCRLATEALRKENYADEDYVESADPTMEEVMEGYRKKPITDSGIQHVSSHNCGACLSYCPVGSWKEKFKDRNLSGGASAGKYIHR